MDSSLPLHRPVLTAETLRSLAPRPGALLLDGTVGTGGHAAAWLEASAPDGRVLALDRDASALATARARLAPYGERVRFEHADYREAPEVLDALGLATVDAVLIDLGLGTHQIDDPARGFAFRFDGPLDMRFDRETPAPTAADLVNHLPEPELARLLYEYGEERASRKLARAIVEARRRHPFRSTGELAALVRAAIPGFGRQRIDPATRTFQALRIAVNRELEGLADALEALVRRLAPGGRLAVIAYHSLEDRIVKHTFRRLAEPCRCRRGDPCTCGALRLIELEERHAIMPGDDELAANPRARSAKLRWGVRR
ncbi:MAG: 16S rRNA (cytosine(1402)-N(4))-methyltransferase RsmH [Acidobacteria bacterium]|nr:16S rRNA (cytosine(1402)-N(4))-methyltransferase RsmH [Acidobacteriota bacterium]